MNENTGKNLWESVKATFKDDNLTLGKYFSQAINNDIKHLVFAFSRYKFASKMLENNSNIELLELGCNEGLGTYFFEQTKAYKKIVGIDLDSEGIKWAKENIHSECIEFIEDDFMGKKYGEFDAVVSLDVIEHIEMSQEYKFMETICSNLKDTGTVIIGTPNENMAPYASEASRVGHINLYNQKRLHNLLSKYFNNVFIFGMNDEVLHTGFYPMSCYIMALCCNKKK